MLIFFCILAASVVAVLIALSITVPLENLVRGVKLISQGELDHPLSSKSSDEIGVLTHHFDQMRANLRLKISEIETLYTLGQEMNSTLDYNALINLILEDIIQALGAEKGSLMLYDEESRKLTIRTARGLSENVIKSTEISEGEGIAGMVLKLKQPILINDCEKDSEFIHLKGGKVASGCLMSVPLLAKDVMRGVINISKSEPNSFSRRDLNFFQGLATQASIALENARLYKLAITDGLTKLYIHRYFQQRLDEEMKRALRYGSEVSLILTDIDHFKNFNDTYGHQQGDRVLKEVSRIMRDSMREVDIVCRYGGEEFTVICPEKSCDEIIIPAERLRKNVEDAQFFINGKRVPITMSMGISTFPVDAEEKKMLIERADQALYYAKEHGRNRICLFRDIKDQIHDELQDESPSESPDESIADVLENKPQGDRA
jgi:diguanylate cyclase (GGDEF)-like protein